MKSKNGLKAVIALTAVTMAIEIIAGTIYNSLAVLSDGWHMFSHVAAFAIALFAEEYAARNKNNPNFAFGVGKVRILGGFTSAVIYCNRPWNGSSIRWNGSSIPKLFN